MSESLTVSEEDAKEYVLYLFDSHMSDIENLTVWEMSEDYFGFVPTDEEFDRIFDYLRTAKPRVEVDWCE